MIVKIYPQNPNEKAIAQVVQALRSDAVIVYPTDSVYAFGCSIQSPKAIDKLRSITEKAGSDFSIVCESLSAISSYAKVDNATFKLLKYNLPGPFTFILEALGKVPDKFLERKKHIGVRIPDNTISQAIVELLGCPLVTASVKSSNEEQEYTTDPSLIYETYSEQIDILIDGGIGLSSPSTIVDCTGNEMEVTRQGVSILKI